MKITVLGTGTSSGVPLPGCKCTICHSNNPLNKRLRTSVFIEATPSASSSEANGCQKLLIDSGPDLRYQSLRARIECIDAVLYTHAHADHINGIDELRSFNFTNNKEIDVFASAVTGKELLERFSYCFRPLPPFGEIIAPVLRLNTITPFTAFSLGQFQILPIPLQHGDQEILGFRIGDFAYLTDCSGLPAESIAKLHNLELLILGALRFRYHPNHFTFEQAVSLVETLHPEKTFFTHMSHEVDYDEGTNILRNLTTMNIQLAYDQMEITLQTSSS